MPERYRQPLLFVAAALVIVTIAAMIAVPFYISRESSDNRERVTDSLNPLEFSLSDADDFLLDVGLTAPQGDAEGPFGSYEISRTAFIGALNEALTHAPALEPEDEALVVEAHRLGETYVEEIADPVNELTIAGDDEGAAAIQDEAVDDFIDADQAINSAVGVTREEINDTLEENSELDELNTVTSATFGVLGIISAAIVVGMTLGVDRAARRQSQARGLAEIERARLDTVIDSIADGVALFSRDGLPIRVNQAGVEMWGISEDEIMNLRAAEVTEPNTLIDQAGNTMTIDDLPSSIAMREDRPVVEMVFTLHRASGEQVDILASAAPLHDFDGNVNGAVVIWHDVTKLRSVERLKDEFLSFAAHELRTPLTVVKGYASVLVRQSSEDPDQREMALAINQEADRMSALISQLLDISKMEAGTLELNIESLQVAEVVEEVVGRHRDLDPERDITIDFDSPDTVCDADPEALTQILDNLLSNARKYSEPGTPVQVRIQSEGDRMRLSVVDRGLGISADEISHLGEKAFRASNSKGRDGSGLGLYIATKYLELQDGTLEVSSTSGKGSTFTVVLPCPDPADMPVRPAESEAVEA